MLALEQLKQIIPKFYSVKKLATSYKKESDKLGTEIKQSMKELDLSSLEVDGVIVTYSEAVRKSFDEPALIAYLKKLPPNRRKGLIRKVETVDMDALESAIYNGHINAADLQPFSQSQSIPTLKVKVKK